MKRWEGRRRGDCWLQLPARLRVETRPFMRVMLTQALLRVGLHDSKILCLRQSSD